LRTFRRSANSWRTREDEAAWKAEFETDLMATVRTVNAAMPFLEKSDAAAIVVISSVSGREVDFAAGPYGVFKAALIHYAKASRSNWR
jgi:NAD(P)-dependent dehydrogenase (short-subunit alcohol dehydrogenase family)